MKRIATITLVLSLAGCATTMPDKAANVQVHSQMSTLLSACKILGPVSGKGEASGFALAGSHVVAAKIAARVQAADKGGDTLVVTNIDEFDGGAKATVQGTALRCY